MYLNNKFLVLSLCFFIVGCASLSDSILGLVPDRKVEFPRVKASYDLATKNLQAPKGKSIIFLFHNGNRGLLESSSAYFNEEGMGKIFPGTYLYMLVDPGDVTLKVTRQMRYSDQNGSYPIAYHSVFGQFTVESNKKYYFELKNLIEPMANDVGYEKNIATMYKLDRHTQQLKNSVLSSVELSFLNRFDSQERGMRKNKTVDFCPMGATVTQLHEPLPCTFIQNF